jgi:hypothetical protein
MENQVLEQRYVDRSRLHALLIRLWGEGGAYSVEVGDELGLF